MEKPKLNIQNLELDKVNRVFLFNKKKRLKMTEYTFRVFFDV